jgi:hypothetical protein
LTGCTATEFSDGVGRRVRKTVAATSADAA